MGDMNYGPLASAFGMLLGLSAVLVVFLLTILLIYLISFWKIFVKAGKPGWYSIIPVYNMIVLAEIAKQPWWYGLMSFLGALAFIPVIGWALAIVGIIFFVLIEYKLVLAFGQGPGFFAGLILLPIVFLPILAFSKDIQYVEGQPNQSPVPPRNPY